MTTTYRIGIDVGGTNTDAVLIDNKDQIIQKIKTFTTLDILSGIRDAIQSLLGSVEVDKSQITHAMLGTTQCTNAIVERKKLEKVVVIRLASPATQAIEAFCDWPDDVISQVKCASYIVKGGYEYDGSPLSPLDISEIKAIVHHHQTQGQHHYAVSCVFSPINNEQELVVRDLILSLDPQAIVSLSSEIGSLNLLERENATILNTALSSVIQDVVKGFEQALTELGLLNAKLYLCQNDGTLMTQDFALAYPVYTIASGPTNSIRGGVYLSHYDNCVILDVGGTTSDLGVVKQGFPQETTLESEIGGVATNFRMPDIVSIAVGGGTIIREKDGQPVIGPDSVGYELGTRAKVFGGDTLTLTDVACKLGYCEIGDMSMLKYLDRDFADRAMQAVSQQLIDAIDLIRTDNQAVDLVVVGGGSVVIPQDYSNVKHFIIPDNQDVANAIGASIAKVSGEFEAVVSFAGRNREQVIEEAVDKAYARAIEAGANQASLEILEIEELPIAYHPEEAVRLRIKVVGDLEANT